MSKFNIDGHKMQYHLDRVEQWKNDPLNTFPVYVEISPVGHCNHRCTFCAVDYIGYKNRKLDVTKLKDSLYNMGYHGVRSVMYAGEGEPLLHPEIGEIVQYTSLLGIDVAFTTNAVALTPKFVDTTLECITWIKISCNAGDPKTYAKIHQTREEDWKKVWKNIEYAVSQRNEKNLKTTIGVQTLLLPDNAETLHDLARRCRDTGVDYLVVKPYSHHHASITQEYKNIKYEDVYKSTLASLQQFVSSKFEITAREKSMESWDSSDRGYSKCYSTPYFWAYIMASGDVYGCSAYLEDSRFKYGNINEQVFSDIWRGERRKASMEYVEHKLDISECRKNCRMDKVNRFLWDVKHPGEHKNFI